MTIQNAWTRLNIGDVCESITDCVNKTAPTLDYKTQFKMLRTTNIKKGWVDINNVSYVSEDTFKQWTRRQTPKRLDVILTREAPLGEVGMLRTDEQVFLGQRLVSYRTDSNKLDPKFLLYAFLTDDLRGQIQSLGFGSTVKHMRVPDAEKLTVLAPDIKIQRKISSIIGAYDDLIENNERRIKILEETVQLLYTEWFVKFRFPGHESTEMINSGPEYGMIPEGWRVTNLNHAVLVNPSNKKGTMYSSLHFSMECLSNSLSSIDLGKLSIKNKPIGSRFMNGDTLFARITPCLQNGKGGYVDFLRDDEFASGSTEFVVLRQKELSSIYIYFLSRDKSFRESAIMTMVGASGRQRVTKGFFESYKVLVPSRTLLDKFESKAKDIFGQIKILDHMNRNLSRMRDLLIPQLVTGKRELK